MATSDQLRDAIEHAEEIAEELGFSFVALLLAMAREETHRTISNAERKDGLEQKDDLA